MRIPSSLVLCITWAAVTAAIASGLLPCALGQMAPKSGMQISETDGKPPDLGDCDLSIDEFTFPCYSGSCRGEWTSQFCVPGSDGNYCYAGYGLCCGEEKETWNVACIGGVRARNRSKSDHDDPNLSAAAILLVPDRCSGSRRYGVLELDSSGIPEPPKAPRSATGGL